MLLETLCPCNHGCYIISILIKAVLHSTIVLNVFVYLSQSRTVSMQTVILIIGVDDHLYLGILMMGAALLH